MAAESCYTCITSVAEVTNHALKHGKDPKPMEDGIEALSQLIFLDKELSALAGKLTFQRKKLDKKWGMMDSFVLAASLLYGLRIVTKDSDFKDLPDAEIL